MDWWGGGVKIVMVVKIFYIVLFISISPLLESFSGIGWVGFLFFFIERELPQQKE